MKAAAGVDALYVDMVERCRGYLLELMTSAREGDWGGMLSRARALHAQVGALCDLLAAREVRHG